MKKFINQLFVTLPVSLVVSCGGSEGLLTENASCLADADQEVVDERDFAQAVNVELNGVGEDGDALYGNLLDDNERQLWGMRLRLKADSVPDDGKIVVKIFEDDVRVQRGAIDISSLTSEYSWHLVRFDTQIALSEGSKQFFTVAPEVDASINIDWSSGTGEGLVEYDEQAQEFVARESREAHYQALYCPE